MKILFFSLATIVLIACSNVSKEVQKPTSTNLKANSITCWGGEIANHASKCPPPYDPFQCWDGSLVMDIKNCPREIDPLPCWDGSYVSEKSPICPPYPKSTSP